MYKLIMSVSSQTKGARKSDDRTESSKVCKRSKINLNPINWLENDDAN